MYTFSNLLSACELFLNLFISVSFVITQKRIEITTHKNSHKNRLTCILIFIDENLTHIDPRQKKIKIKIWVPQDKDSFLIKKLDAI